MLFEDVGVAPCFWFVGDGVVALIFDLLLKIDWGVVRCRIDACV